MPANLTSTAATASCLQPGGDRAGKDAPDRLQWAMNHCLAQIGITHEEHRARAIGIGERLEVLKDYPTSPGCTSPYAPVWIEEMVRRAG
ncbi:hypothetical protein NKG94_02940 [Micromonospora sp. M12]